MIQKKKHENPLRIHIAKIITELHLTISGLVLRREKRELINNDI